MTAEQMLELAERVEKASGPDRELDAQIAAAAGIIDFEGRHGILGTPFFRVSDDGRRVHFCTRLDDGSEHSIASREPRSFTASLDAAKTLKHPADLWCVGNMEDGPFARVVPAIPGGIYGEEITVHAETVENALTAAFLRAAALRSRAAMMGEGE